MSSTGNFGHQPIYDRLIEERGDIPAQTRSLAEQTRTQAQRALDWSALRESQRERDNRAFSAFG